MAEIIKFFKEDIPNLRFIGKKYDNFGHWGEWWQNCLCPCYTTPDEKGNIILDYCYFVN